MGGQASRSGAITLPRLLAAFLRLGCTSFGGGTVGWLYRDIVLRRGWVDDQAFLAMLSLGQAIPGSNGIKMTVLIGQQLRGMAGASVALIGLLLPPFLLMLALGSLYAGFGEQRMLHAALDGIAAVVVGLTFATGLHGLVQSRPSVAGIVLAAATVLAIGIMHWPILPVVAALVPLGIGLALIEPSRR